MYVKKQTISKQMIAFSVLLIIILAVQLFVQGQDKLIFLILCFASSLIFSLPLAFNDESRFYHPYVFILLATLIGVTLRGFYMVYEPDDPLINSFFLRNENISYFTTPALMLFSGLLIFTLAYRFTGGAIGLQKLKTFKYDYLWNQRRVNTLTAIYSLISIAGIILFIRVMGISSITSDISAKRFAQVSENDTASTSYGYYRIMANFIQPLLYIFLVNFIVEKKKILSFHGLVLGLIAVANLFFPIFTSSRSDLLTIFLNVFIVLSLLGRFNVRLIAIVTPIAMLLFAIMTLLRPAKSNDVNTANINLLEPFLYNKNLLDVSKTAHVINGVPSKMPYEFGASYMALIYAPVPRQWWPDKPVLSASKDIAHKIYGYSENNQAGIPPGMAGEAYLNFAYPGLLLLFLLSGVLIKKTYNSFDFEKGALNKNRIVLYVTVVVYMTIILFGSSVNQAILAVAQNYVPLWIALRYISEFKKPVT